MFFVCSEEFSHSNMEGKDWNSTTKWQLRSPQSLMNSIRCVFCSSLRFSGGCSSSVSVLARVHSWMELSSRPVASLNQFFFERARTCVPDNLDLSLCTVGTSSAFLQTADNICLLTCTVTCRTLLTLQIILPPDPPSCLVCPIPPSSPKLGAQPVPPPQAASSQCKLNLHFLLCRLDWPDSVLLLLYRSCLKCVLFSFLRD